MPTVAAVIIGREILTGKFPDENGPFFIRRMRQLGASLQRLTIVDDDVEAIASEVRRCAAGHDHVVTTGGVGPTHDDCTFEAIARAFGVELVEEPTLVRLMERVGIPLDRANLRMARVPAGSELVGAEDRFPVIRCRNVWIFPGVPRLVQRKFQVVEPYLRGPPVHHRRLYLSVHEAQIAATLTDLVAKHPGVDVGSYPRTGADGVRLILTLESTSLEALRSAEEAFCEVLPVDRRSDT